MTKNMIAIKDILYIMRHYPQTNQILDQEVINSSETIHIVHI